MAGQDPILWPLVVAILHHIFGSLKRERLIRFARISLFYSDFIPVKNPPGVFRTTGVSFSHQEIPERGGNGKHAGSTG